MLSSFDQDTLEIISADAQHSSSIIDMFTSFQQMVDFIQKLDWPTATENLNFYYAILYDIVSAVGYYCQLTNGFVERDLSLTKGCQPPPPSDSASIGKLKVKLPKMIRKKRIAEQNSKLIQGTRLAPVVIIFD